MGITDYFKLHRADALLRVRSNFFTLLLIAVLSTLVPRIPALPTALAVALSSRRYRWGTTDWIYTWFCILEVGAVALLSLNILQAVYAVKYPRAPPPPPPTPAKSKAVHVPAPTPKRAFRLSPNSSPQLQKSFSFGTSGSVLQSSSTSAYPSSPVSTPSRVLNYSLPPSSSTSTFVSSTSSINTPSPILSTYLGKHGGEYIARPFDGAFLAEIRNHPDSDEE
ncbi:hypothetical protein DFH08DRAFT_838362 [Mycena albidolilacea]|uniref:Uncharacterized protein n=1 Tax=Mycena albidolilacea TaxID=1033008 RepID=A0AAD7ANZ8_9AGAR|nr:hypothetical protein DFH08DRAFT_838362 [Mycena albidolilacea]